MRGNHLAPSEIDSAERPAFCVKAAASLPGTFSDNAVTLLPGRPVSLAFAPRQDAALAADALQAGLRMRHLRESL